jgi:putative tricarboxylic transport membrane protein
MDFSFAPAVDAVLQPHVLLLIAASAVYGVFMGAALRVSPATAVVLLVPVALFLDAVSAVAAVVTTVTCCIVARDVQKDLPCGVPQESTSSAWPWFSLLGGFLGAGVLCTATPMLAGLPLAEVDWFWLCLLALSCAAIFSGQSRLKGVFAASLGLLVATVGVSPDHENARFAFHAGLVQGVSFLPAMIGLFGLSHVLRASLEPLRDDTQRQVASVCPPGLFRRAEWNAAAKHAWLAAAWAPALALNIPGDSVTAIALGMLSWKNVTAGPSIAQQPILIAVVVALLMASVLVFPLGWAGMRCRPLLSLVPRRTLLPVMLVLCVVGAYACAGNLFDVWIMLAMGLVGLLLESWGVPLFPVVLGIALGSELEHRFIQSYVASQAWWEFFSRPLSALMAVTCLALWLGPLPVRMIRRRLSRRAARSRSPRETLALAGE